MPFTDRFQLFDLRRDEGARTYEAREIVTGRPVLVHVFPNRTAPLNRVLLAKLDTLPEEERARVIERGDHERGVYLVTDRLAEFPGLAEWLTQKHAVPAKPSAPPPAAPPSKESVDDQLAGLFETAPRPMLEPSPAAPPPAPVLTNTGEQTLQIPRPVESVKAPEVPQAPVAPVSPLPEAAPVAPAPPEPGEFTRQFAPVLRPVAPAPAAPQAPTAVPSPPQATEPGEFTRQFAPVIRPPAAPPAPAPAAPMTPPAAPPPSAAPGEFTSLFSAPKPEHPTKPEQPMGEFTRQFQAPLRPVSGPPPSVQTPPPAQSNKQEGEFTQMLKAQHLAAPVPPANQSTANQGAKDFDNYFSPMTPAPLGAAQQLRPLTPPPTPPLRPARDGGEFTQVFGPGDIASPAPPPTPASSGATQVFRAPAPMAPPVANIPAQQGSDDWGRMFEKPAALTFGQAPAPAARMPEPAPANPNSSRRNNSQLPLLLIIGALVLLVAAMIVYLIMRPHPA